MDNIKTYSPSQVSLSFGGVVVQGWDSIRIVKDFPDFKMVHGIRGKNTRVISKNTAASVEIVLVQTSWINEAFMDILKLDRASGARIRFLLRDILGHEVFGSDEAFLEGMPERDYTSELGTRTWVLRCLSSRENDIGNSSGNGNFYDIDPSSFGQLIST